MTQHKHPPKWYGQGYASLPGWERAVEECRQLLEGWARRGYVGTYSEVSAAVTAVPWPDGPHTHEGQQMGYLLGNVVVNEWLHDRPLLSALVVLAGDRVPGRGFYNVAQDLGLLPVRNEEAELIFFGQEQERCLEYWRKAP